MQMINDCDTIILKKDTFFKLITLLLLDKAVSMDKIEFLVSPEKNVTIESTGTSTSSVSSEDEDEDEEIDWMELN
jgi:hypothetical protein